ncbi:hypothetical protein PT974_03241 [Cladobotryum mycophilum]|uniref:N-acetyltransferase domain-containing protein n=1 Tax=Cladobotryum mycophilum TaxID=491253 RepID=A0ABR0SRR1_9HYPO
MAILVREANKQDLPAIARIASTAFHPTNDIVSRNLFPSYFLPTGISAEYAAYWWRFLQKKTSLDDQHTLMTVAIDSCLDHQIVGFASWELPHGDEAHEATPVEPNIPEPPELDRNAFDEFISALDQDHKATFGERGIKDVWHLDHFGVDLRHQRKGVGKVLLEWGLRHAAKEGRDCYLTSTPAGKSLYTAAGFEVVRPVPVFGELFYSMILKHKDKREEKRKPRREDLDDRRVSLMV